MRRDVKGECQAYGHFTAGRQEAGFAAPVHSDSVLFVRKDKPIPWSDSTILQEGAGGAPVRVAVDPTSV